MIADQQRLLEVIEEIAEWPLDRRRRYIFDIGQAFGEAASEQIKTALTAAWEKRKG